MLNYIWGFMILASIVASLLLGNTEALTNGTLQGAADGLQLLLTILPMMVLWTGMMEIAQAAGITEKIAKFFYPVLKRIFPDLKPGSPALECICLNLSANLLGIGNAATPFGLRAMDELRKLSPHSEVASNNMIMFVVMNTAAIQLLPTTIGMLRYNAGSTSPFDILPGIWVTSVIALVFAVVLAKALNKMQRKKVGKSPSA
ncbi:MAG: spore maturation protein A [Oscillospiraceae bacterium]|jgi:spore maturation protein A|nr:spore maturation protein A [Oscillospiraceae bacterium]